jgi:N-acetylmuramoyl-L-alanine amidase
MRRTLGIVLLAMGLSAAPVSADHGPTWAVSCPTGTAQVVLDPGHGGPDPGAVYEDFALHESDQNLVIAGRVAELLRADGVMVALTRDDPGTELGNSERGEIANACAATVFVEIHLNGAEDRTVNYAQTFWGEKEKDLAFALVMNDALGALGIPVQGVDRFDNGGLLRAKMPSVLVEAVFLSSTEEARALADGTRQEAIAQAIATGITSYLAIATG